MLIYKQEKLDGLEEAIGNSTFASIQLEADVFVPKSDKLDILIAQQKQSEKYNALLSSSANSHDVQMDLYYVNTILASVGWNGNDDVFLKKELYLARDTAIDKFVNMQHNPKHIVGHIIGSSIVDNDLEFIDTTELSIDDIPDMFHVLANSVIYKHINSPNKDLEKSIAEFIVEIENNKWRVSMECLFPDFDYAMITADDKHEIVERNEKTSFLTKHLRAYGGKGVFQDRKIGRAIRNIVFSGKGFVKKPANKNSIVINTIPFYGMACKNDFIPTTEQIMENKKDSSNAVATVIGDNTEIVNLQRQVAELKQQYETEKVQKKYDEYAATIATLQQEVESHKAKVAELTTANDTLNTAKASLVAELDETKKTLTTKSTELVNIQASIKRTERITILVDKGVDKARAEVLTDKFTSLSDEQFNEIADMQAAVAKKDVTNKTEASETQLEVEVDKSDKSADTTVLDTAKVTDSATLTVAADTTEKSLSQDLSNYLATQIKLKRTRK